MNQTFIPEKLKVGFQKRNDTFTGKLSFITPGINGETIQLAL